MARMGAEEEREALMVPVSTARAGGAPGMRPERQPALLDLVSLVTPDLTLSSLMDPKIQQQKQH